MNITSTTGLVGFLLALSALNLPQAEAKAYSTDSNLTQMTIEQRLAKISAIIKEQEDHLLESTNPDIDSQIAGAWGNGRGRGWADGRSGSGWADGRSGGGWVNGRNGGGWVNGRNWSDGGGFWNRRY
ncbi:conserved hypothetical protein [Gloeothece citriformis PCC 7424]|uniref:RSAM-associated Gly-rich repeat protein n=1 Tax=Gloeothece citriformis (strain PCC 7424) TaxID=65393 RepID=B7KDY2_GLOC7|nr:GrrA/OscA1 family cyclophane-containing rSAM-modified RiPP [Gloeothece citriformis]ACK71680.1 conserved hypothetical protein [Gloeothece citriformis PCC 7424]